MNDDVKQVVASLELSGFKVTEDVIRDLEDVAAGRKNIEQSLQKIDKKYKNCEM